MYCIQPEVPDLLAVYDFTLRDHVGLQSHLGINIELLNIIIVTTLSHMGLLACLSLDAHRSWGEQATEHRRL